MCLIIALFHTTCILRVLGFRPVFRRSQEILHTELINGPQNVRNLLASIPDEQKFIAETKGICH